MGSLVKPPRASLAKRKQTMKLYCTSFKAMGSPCEFKLYIPDSLKQNTVFQRLHNEVQRFERKYSRYLSDSVTSSINSSAGTGKKIKVDMETARLLDYAAEMYRQSNGLFDISSGILRQLWNFKAQHIPSEIALQAITKKIGWEKIEWNGESIMLPIAGMEIDFGGYVKEYAADVCATRCVEMEIYHGLINLGGDVRIVGPHPDGSSWKVGIQHPRQPDRAIATIDIEQGAVATSGDYERYMMVYGKRYCHLLNPKTGHSIQPFYAGVSIVAPQCLIAGSFSSIAMLMSETDPHWLEECGLPWLAVDQNMEIHGTVG